MNESLAIFLTYSWRPHFKEQGYEDWLREHDNPFFNSIPGIARYENWVLMPPYNPNLGFDYFDLVYLNDSRALKSVWFNRELTKFRRNWVAKWGYPTSPPPVVNGQGYLLQGGTMPRQPPDVARLEFSDEGLDDAWTITAILPKHYAYPEGAAPEPWQSEDLSMLPLPGRVLRLSTSADSLQSRRIA